MHLLSIRWPLAAVTLLTAACSPDQAPTAPSLAKGPGGLQFSAAPTSVQFTLPPGGSEVLTATSQYVTIVSASTSDAGCATVSPASAPTRKPKSSSSYIATFTLVPTGVGTCTITLSDKNGKSATVQVTVVAPLPDRIVYVAWDGDQSDLWVMDLDGQNKAALTATANIDEYAPSLSADGRRVLFMSSPETFTHLPTIIQIDGTGRTTLPIADLNGVPSLSPDGRRLAFTKNVENHSRIFTADLAGQNLVQLSFPTTEFGNAERDPTWAGSPPGRIAYVEGSPRSIWIMNADGGGKVMLKDNTDNWLHGPPLAALSPDGQKVAFTCQPETHKVDICVVNTDGTGLLRLTDAIGRNDFPRWTRDGRIIFTSQRDGNGEVYIMNSDGTSQTNLTASLGSQQTR
jgi:Tol biopolymer transport system component